MMFTLVERELAAGVVAGSDYGAQVRVVARSPSHVLFNALGVQLWDRDERGGWHSLKSLTRSRATIAVYGDLREKLDEVFGAGATDQIIAAWRTNKTVLVDDGGKALPLPRRIRVSITKAQYAEKSADWTADLTGQVHTCKQCGKNLRLNTRNHQLGFEIKPDHPRTAEDCQRLTNFPVVAVHGYGIQYKDRYGLAAWFETWDGESYLDEDFCGDTCAAKYGRRAAKAFEPLPVGVEPVKQAYVHQPSVDHYEKQVRIMRLNDGSEFKV